MRVVRNRHLVVEPPTQFAVASEKVVDQALNDLAKRSLPTRYRILERLIPRRPGILLAYGSGRLEQLPARREGRGDFGRQLSREHANRFFDIDRPTVDGLGPEQLRKFLQNVFSNHDSLSAKNSTTRAQQRGSRECRRLHRCTTASRPP